MRRTTIPHLPTPTSTNSSLTNFADWASWWQILSGTTTVVAEDPRRPLISTDAIRSQLFGDEAFRDRGCCLARGAAPISANRCANLVRSSGSLFTMPQMPNDDTGEKSLHLPVLLALPTLLGCG